MKLLFKQRFFSWFDSYDIYYEDGSVAYTVKGQLSWRHCLRIFDAAGNFVGTVREIWGVLMPKFGLYIGEHCVGCIRKKWGWLRSQYFFDCNGWRVLVGVHEWSYSIVSPQGALVAKIGKEIWNWTDTYVLDVADPQNALLVLMFTLAVDAEKCSRS